jgi:hypothetical protein
MTSIGKGDYEIEAIVELYSLEGREVDLAKVQFRVSTSYMVIEGTSNDRVLLDSANREQSVCFVSGVNCFLQKFHVCVSYLPAVNQQNGKIYLHGMLTDRFGRCPKAMSYLIAEWHNCSIDKCDRINCAPVIRMIVSGLLKIDVTLIKDSEKVEICPPFNVASVSFIDLSTGLGLVHEYKMGWRHQDPIFLFDQNLEERCVSLCPAGGLYSDSVVREVKINNILLTIPNTDINGSLCINGFYKVDNKWYIIQPHILTQWTIQD